MFHFFRTLGLFAALASLVACSDQSSRSTMAAANVADSFSVENTVTPSKNGAFIVVKKSALEKEFLLQAQFISQILAPSFNGLKSRVVTFKQVRDRVFLLEATQGHVVTHELPSEIILAAFPIVRETSDSLTLDFNSGMSETYVMSDWYASDYNGPGYGGTDLFSSAKLTNSYLADVYLSARNDLTIVQRGRISESGYNIPLETRFYISPYRPDTSYSAVRSGNFNFSGYFEIAPLLTEDGVTAVYASRFHPSRDQKIVFAVSPNTPAEYRDAVKDGILYWNQAFGYEKIQAIDAPAGLSAPNPDYNIVQWVTWDTAGSAYADAQMDPRTGQILHAQVYMTSAFAFSGRNRARWLLQKLDYQTTHPEKLITVAGIASSVLCDKKETAKLRETLEMVVHSDLNDDKILELSRDYIREVIAHEVGHTLGLRHNFAGSLGSNRTVSETRDDFNRYLTSLLVSPSHRYTSSVMEYQQYIPSTLSGRLIKNLVGAFEYDKVAISHLYEGKVVPSRSTPLFCTDSHAAAGFTDCVRFDEGPSVIENASYALREGIKDVPRQLLVTLLSAKYAQKGVQDRDFDVVPLNADGAALMLLAPRAEILKYFIRENKDLRIHRKYPRVDSTTSENIIRDQVEYLAGELQRLGGLNAVLAQPEKDLAATWSGVFEEMIRSESYRSGVGLDGAKYSLSDEDIAKALDVAESYFTALEEALVRADVASLAVNGTIVDADISAQLATLLKERTLHYLLSATSEKTSARIHLGTDEKSGEEKSVEVQLPKFLYSQKVRALAAGLLLGKKVENPVWNLSEQTEVKEQFSSLMKTILAGNPLESIKAEAQDRAVARWVIDNKAVWTVLNSK